MSSISFNSKSFDQPIGPTIDQQVGPEVIDQPIGPGEESQNNSSAQVGPFQLMERKYFPLTRQLMTGSWNGDMGHLSVAKKILALFVGSILTLLTSVVCAPFIALKNRQIQAFNTMAPEDQVNTILNKNLDKVVDAAKAYQRSPDDHQAKQKLGEANRALGEALDKIQFEFPNESNVFEQFVREKVENELGSLVISIKPQSSQDQHRFTVPLAKLVLDGFYPMINGKPNPSMKGVKAESITFQFEDGIFSLSQERVTNIFLTQSATNPTKAMNDLQKNLEKIQRPTTQETNEVRLAITNTIAEKLSNPTSPEFQNFVAGALQQCEADGPGVAKIMTDDQLKELTESLVSASILSEEGAEVFSAQVLGTDAPNPSKLEAQTKKHEQQAKKGAAVLIPVGIVSALQRLGFEPIKRTAKFLADHIMPTKLLDAVDRLATVIGKDRLNAIAPKAVALGTGALGLYTLYQGYKALTGPRLTKGQEAAQSFADAMQLRKTAFEKLRDIEFQTVEGDTLNETQESEINALQESIITAESVIGKAGEALEAAGKNPTPKNIERAVVLAEKANQQFEEIAEQAEILESAVQKANAEKVGPPSYMDLDRYFAEAKKAFKRIDKRLKGAQGVSIAGGKKIDELQSGLRKKVKALAAFEMSDLEKARPDIERVAVLEKEIQTVLDNKKADPAKVKKWEKSLPIMRQELSFRKDKIRETHLKHEYLKNEIVQMRELISLMGSSPEA
jgi:hypothetical protein